MTAEPRGGAGWPLHDLVLRTERLVLRGMDGPTALALAELLPDDVELHPAITLADRRAASYQAWARTVATWSPDDWVLPFAVSDARGLVGLQALEGRGFAARREVDSHSWLVPGARGRGLGKEARAAVLALAFEHLGATRAVTEAWHDNAASLGVSRALGYVDAGQSLVDRGGVPTPMVAMELTHAVLPSVQVSGLEPCLPLLGLG